MKYTLCDVVLLGLLQLLFKAVTLSHMLPHTTLYGCHMPGLSTSFLFCERQTLLRAGLPEGPSLRHLLPSQVWVRQAVIFSCMTKGAQLYCAKLQ